jgi:putative membrane protein
MRRILYRWFVNTAALLITAYLLKSRVYLDGTSTAIVAAAILGIVNVVLKPVLLLLTLPINILTLGLFTFVVNGLMLLLVSNVVSGFQLQGGISSAIVVALVMTVVSWIINELLGD